MNEIGPTGVDGATTAQQTTSKLCSTNGAVGGSARVAQTVTSAAQTARREKEKEKKTSNSVNPRCSQREVNNDVAKEVVREKNKNSGAAAQEQTEVDAKKSSGENIENSAAMTHSKTSSATMLPVHEFAAQAHLDLVEKFTSGMNAEIASGVSSAAAAQRVSAALSADADFKVVAVALAGLMNILRTGGGECFSSFFFLIFCWLDSCACSVQMIFVSSLEQLVFLSSCSHVFTVFFFLCAIMTLLHAAA